jgi:hypothetical protein
VFDLIPLVGIVTSSAVVVWVVAIVTKSRQARVEAQVAMQTKLIERFGTAPELVEFLHSPAGRQFVAGVQAAPVALTRERILSSFTRAIIMSSLGVAFLALGFVVDDTFFIPASIVLSLGVGYLIATLVSFKMSKTFAAEPLV